MNEELETQEEVTSPGLPAEEVGEQPATPEEGTEGSSDFVDGTDNA
jgi:hypothetical protein